MGKTIQQIFTGEEFQFIRAATSHLEGVGPRCATRSVIPLLVAPLRSERETEIKSEPIVQSPNIPQRGWPFTKFYRCTRAELAECSERGRSVGEQGVGETFIWLSLEQLETFASWYGERGRQEPWWLAARWRTVVDGKRSDLRGNVGRKQTPPSAFPFFCAREERGQSVYRRGEGRRKGR